MPTPTIHVEPNSKGRWVVRHEGEREPLSEHESAADAERLARALAQREDASLVVLHDRYARTYHVPIAERATAKPGTTPAHREARRNPPPPATPR